MKIILKHDWDTPVQAPSKQSIVNRGHFVGRDVELSVFVNELLRREQGAVLITGYRGVGKTTFVYKALQKLLEQSDKDKILMVLINANHLETNSQDRLDPKSILVNLIRRLYAVCQEERLNSALKQGVESLYKKAISTEFKLSGALEKSRQSSKETEVSKQTEINAQQIGVTQVIWIVCFIFALILQFFPIFPNPLWLNRLLPLVFAFPIPLTLSLFWRHRKSSITSEAFTDSAKQLYTVDNSINNLEFDLEKLHRDLRNSGIKTIYVLDELDKLETQTVFEIMKYYKNLFTLSSAIFVFVGGEDIFNQYQDDEEREFDYSGEGYRPLKYTYFTSKYFLSRPKDTDLLSFLDEIIYNSNELNNIDEYEFYKRALILDSSCDYFDLIQVIKGRISSFDGTKPILDEAVDEEKKNKAKLQQALSVVYRDKYAFNNPSKWSENETVLRKLYKEALVLLNSSPGSEIHDTEIESKPYPKDRHNPILVSAVNDFHNFLQRVGFLDFADYSYTTTSSYGDGGTSTTTHKANKYYLTRRFQNNIPTKLLFLSQLEEELVRDIENVYQIVMNYWNIHAVLEDVPAISLTQFRENPVIYAHKINSWGTDAKNAIIDLDQTYHKLTKSYPSPIFKGEDVELYTKNASDALNRLIDNSHNILARIFQDSLQQPNLQIVELSQHIELFTFGSEKLDLFRKQMLDLKIPHKILTNQDFSNSLMFCQKLTPGIWESVQNLNAWYPSPQSPRRKRQISDSPTRDEEPGATSDGTSDSNRIKREHKIVIVDYRKGDLQRALGPRYSNDYSFGFSLYDDSLTIQKKIREISQSIKFD